MKSAKSLILIAILTFAVLSAAGAGFAANNTNLEKHDFDSFFEMNVPKGISFERHESTPSKNINLSVNYQNDTENINIVYVESTGTKDNLLKYYEEFAKNNTNITINTVNNTTLIHFKDTNIIGETNYHDLAIVGNNSRYILMQCDNETLMKSMAESIRFKWII